MTAFEDSAVEESTVLDMAATSNTVTILDVKSTIAMDTEKIGTRRETIFVNVEHTRVSV
jgi:hypothetical protein